MQIRPTQDRLRVRRFPLHVPTGPSAGGQQMTGAPVPVSRPLLPPASLSVHSGKGSPPCRDRLRCIESRGSQNLRPPPFLAAGVVIGKAHALTSAHPSSSFP